MKQPSPKWFIFMPNKHIPNTQIITEKKLTIMKNSIFMLLVTMLLSIPLHSQQNSVSDQAIKNNVMLELQLQPDVSSHLIDVSVDDGIVTLSGYTDNLLARDRAVKTTKSVKGVRGVLNQVMVTTPVKTDNEIEQDITEAFLRNAATDLFEINVSVNNAEAILNGEVDSWQEKKLAAYVAKGIKGVVSIENNIKVNYNENRSDFDIQKDIEGLLANDVRISGENISVKVNDGNVSLNGEVGSAAKKAHAEILSWVAGVKNVNIENLSVDTWVNNQNRKNIADYNRSNKEVETAIKEIFRNDPRLHAFKIQVESNDGMVILSGKVDNLQSKYAAKEDASNVIGVYSIKNFITVRPNKVPSDKILKSRVDAGLTKDPYIERFEINILTRNGKVFLSGLVDNYFEKYHAENVVSSINGVVNVDNNIDVRDEINTEDVGFNYAPDWYDPYPMPYTQSPDLSEFREDWEIKQEIENQLWWSPNVNEYEVSVKVNDGTAILTGTVDTWKEKENATKNAIQGGAEKVKNKLDVRAKPELEE